MKERLPTTRPLKVFLSYSHEDESYLNELKKHLKILERLGLIEPWHDREIQAGQYWAGEIDQNLMQADIVLMLISANFIASGSCIDVELARAAERQAEGSTRIIPIIVSDCLTDGLPLKQVQWLPRDAKPVDAWQRRNDAWKNVTEGIHAVIKELQGKETAETVAEPPATASTIANKPSEVATKKRKRPRSGQNKSGKKPPRQKSSETEKNYSEAVLEVLRSLPATRGLYVHPYIPDERQTEARQACEIPSIENILGVIYYTIFFVSKRYIVFCDSGIYMNLDPSPPVIRYSDFARREFGKTGQYLELGLNQRTIMADDVYDDEYMLKLLLQIKDAVK